MKRFRPYLLAALPTVVCAVAWLGAGWLAGQLRCVNRFRDVSGCSPLFGIDVAPTLEVLLFSGPTWVITIALLSMFVLADAKLHGKPTARFLALMIFFLTFGWYLLWAMDHTVYQYARSPGGQHVAYFMQLGEGETPPYGHAIKLASAWNPLGELTGTYLFKGGCGTASLEWESDRELVLTCKTLGIITLVRQHGDITLRTVEHGR